MTSHPIVVYTHTQVICRCSLIPGHTQNAVLLFVRVLFVPSTRVHRTVKGGVRHCFQLQRQDAATAVLTYHNEQCVAVEYPPGVYTVQCRQRRDVNACLGPSTAYVVDRELRIATGRRGAL